MEEDIMYSTELMRKLPDNPEQPILYVVYNDQMIPEAKALIGTIHGQEYVDEHVTVVSFKVNRNLDRSRNYAVYIDPTVFTYKNSWND